MTVNPKQARSENLVWLESRNLFKMPEVHSKQPYGLFVLPRIVRAVWSAVSDVNNQVLAVTGISSN